VGRSVRRRGRGVRPGGAADQPGFECLGTEQAAGDAREDKRDVAGAERVRVAAECGGEVSAVVDELPDEGEEAAEAVGFGAGGGRGGGHAGHMSTGGESASRNLFLVTQLTNRYQGNIFHARWHSESLMTRRRSHTRSFRR
jgi:hypothetical protein